ncbi:MAG: M28 family peptidase [Ignavibacteria bacterium]|nr:M28 family peptidase [Ignavibacteria bacterium]
MIRTRHLLLAVFIMCLVPISYSQPVPGLPIDPSIQEMMSQVSADTLFSNLTRLVGFETRHTNSDTVSDAEGIGAARRFVFGQFQNYASDPAVVELQPSYFTFEATVCGLTGEHRNILATLPGAEWPERHFIVMGHIDGRNQDNCDAVGSANGANDDCSGTVVAMEMARVMSRFAMESTVILMPVTGEKQGLFQEDGVSQVIPIRIGCFIVAATGV